MDERSRPLLAPDCGGFHGQVRRVTVGRDTQRTSQRGSQTSLQRQSREARVHLLARDFPTRFARSGKTESDTPSPALLVASIERCPVYGGTPRSFNADQVEKLTGVRAVPNLRRVHLTHQFGDHFGPWQPQLHLLWRSRSSRVPPGRSASPQATPSRMGRNPFHPGIHRLSPQQMIALTSQARHASSRKDGDFDLAHASHDPSILTPLL